KDADAVLAHAAGSVGDDLMLVLELDAEGGVREQLRHYTGKFQEFFLRHSLSTLVASRRDRDPSQRQIARKLADDGALDNRAAGFFRTFAHAQIQAFEVGASRAKRGPVHRNTWSLRFSRCS